MEFWVCTYTVCQNCKVNTQEWGKCMIKVKIDRFDRYGFVLETTLNGIKM